MKKIIIAAVFLLSPISAFALTVSPSVGSNGLVNVTSTVPALHTFIVFMPLDAPSMAGIYVQQKNSVQLNGASPPGLLSNLSTRTTPVNPLPKDLIYRVIESDLSNNPNSCIPGGDYATCKSDLGSHVVGEATYHYVTTVISGCTDPAAVNYNASANLDDGSCSYTVPNPVLTTIDSASTTLYTSIGVNSADIGTWAMSNVGAQILGAAFGFLQTIFPYILALVIIAAIVYFLYRGFRFMRH